LKGITLSIRQGEFVSIVGPSGAGKSTLMHMIGCVDTPTSGSMTIDNVETSRLKENELAQLRNMKLGFVFQQFFLLPTLTALENVLLPTIFSHNGRANNKQQKAKQILDLVDLSGRASHLPSQLSGGEMQRVALARALINDPKILLADEPTGNLDSKNAEIVFAIFRKLHLAGLTIIVVTHNAELADRAERSFHLKDGRILNSTS
jgi:putative ABC transport system ATP-binding protein